MKTERERKENAVWKATHRDYKGILNGRQTIMVLRNGGSTLVTLAGLTDEELDRKLPKDFK